MDLDTALENGIVWKKDKLFICQICKSKNQGGRNNITEHLQGKCHKNSLLRYIIRVSGTRPLPDSLRYEQVAEIIYFAEKGKIKMDGDGFISCSLCHESFPCTQGTILFILNHMEHHHGTRAGISYFAEEKDYDLINALEKKDLTKLERGQYKCNFCQKIFSNGTLAREHLSSCDERRQPLPATKSTPSYERKVVQRNVYQIKSSPRGIVCMMNNILRGSSSYREGAEADSGRIRQTFGKMGYKVAPFEDVSQNGVLGIAKKIQKLQQELRTDCLICFVLSHGIEGDFFQTYDKIDTFVSFDAFRGEFLEGDIPEFKGKPKIFFSNFCRGEASEFRPRVLVEDRALPTIEPEKNTVVFYASVPKVTALRDTATGTIMVSAICDVLDEHKELELEEFYRLTQKQMKRNGGTTMEKRTFDFTKDFYF